MSYVTVETRRYDDLAWSLKALSVERIKIAKYERNKDIHMQDIFPCVLQNSYVVCNRKKNKCFSTVFHIQEFRSAIRYKMYVPLTVL